MTELRVDDNCVPFRRKRVYWALTVPYLLLLVTTAVYLWRFSATASLVYMSFYPVSIILHGYACAFGGCPYKGTMCPGAFGYFPVGKVTLLYDKLKVRKSEVLVAIVFLLLMILLVGIVTFPLYWINKLGTGFAVGYVVFLVVYFAAFLISVCPGCAMRCNCPAARLSNILTGALFNKDILSNR